MLNIHLKNDIIYRTDPFPVVSVFDGSIDWEAGCKKDDYLKHREFSKLSLNGAATVFYLKLLPENMLASIVRHAYDARGLNIRAAYRMAFMMCVIKVENLVKKDGNTVFFETREESLNVPGANASMQMITEKDMVEYFGHLPSVVEEIGSVAFQRHFLAEGTATQFKPTAG
jgi:hypothetical protein